ncbi:hypothetical protein [Variovorax sp. RA8]|uniref:hypothetical protein n=1 Tax=Variovorax sp. (strain JCM 16519 / RA8) TaxID=662548 RepID=UPI000A4482D7|nr:hypothetical protein [Variovorax sp. RA8]VTU14352.1 hypothetical protein RA8CHR_00548 [Variovorax sp. RA8]
MTTFSKGRPGRIEYLGAYRDLVEGMRRVSAAKVGGKYAGVTWGDVRRAAERLDEQRITTGRYSAAIFEKILSLTLARAQAEAKAKRTRVVFVKSLIPTAAHATAKKPLTDQELRAIARRLSLR